MLSFTTRIHEAASTDDTRPVLTYIKVADGFAWATDSYILAKAPVEGDTEGMLPALAGKKAWVSTGRSSVSHPVSFENDTWNVAAPNATTLFANAFNGAVFPDCASLLDNALDRLSTAEDAITIGVDVERLLRAARAINANGVAHVRLTIDRLCGEKSHPILVRPLDASSEAAAIVMPMRQS